MRPMRSPYGSNSLRPDVEKEEEFVGFFFLFAFFFSITGEVSAPGGHDVGHGLEAAAERVRPFGEEDAEDAAHGETIGRW